MKEIIEKGYLYIAMPPLYRITLSGGKFRYFLNDEEYNQFINESIINNYKFIVNGKTFSSEKNVTTLMKLLYKYNDYIDKFCEDKLINKEFLDLITTLYRINKENYPDLKSFANLVKNNGDFVFFKNSNGKTEFSGLFRNSFVNEEVSELFKYVKKLNEYLDSIKLPININFEGKNIDDNLLAVNYKNIIDAVTPKSRVRMKGLGEMDADELWETTMNPDTRNLIQVTINDYDKAFETMEDLLNGDSKYADRRKSFILKNQSSAKNLDV